MKIRKLQLKNIGVFDNETIEFQPCPVKDKAEIHIFTGQNGSGKSTLLMALASAFDDGNPQESLRNSLHKRFKHINETEADEIKNQIYVRFENGVISSIEIPPRRDSIEIPNRNKISQDEFIALHHPLLNYRHVVSGNAPKDLSFAVFALSGYRQIKNERVEAIKDFQNFNSLYQSLDFIKDYSEAKQLTINQLLANNISKSAIEKERNKEKSQRFAKVITSIEQAISEITNWKVEFDLETEPINLITKINNEKLDFDALPDGLKSLISWIADLLGRIDLIGWQDDLPIFEKNLILLLDEIEVHLHPAWQRKVLPVVQKLFKNSQIFVSTHSPFVVNSIDDAWIYKLELENGKAKVAEVIKSEDGFSYSHVLSEIFDIEEEFGVGVQKDLAKFKELRNKILVTKNGSDKTQKEFLQLAKSLAIQSEELQTIVQFELRQLSKRIGKNLTI